MFNPPDPYDQEVVVGMVEAAARSLDDLDGHLPGGPGTVEEMSHQTNSVRPKVPHHGSGLSVGPPEGRSIKIARSVTAS